MSVLVFLILAVAIGWLWNRVGSLERRVAELDGQLSAVARHAAPAAAVRREFAEPAPPEVITASPAEPVPVAEPAVSKVAKTRRPRFDFEDLFGRLLPIWAGGVTLAVAGFFLVRW